MSKVIAVCGRICSGKTTYAKRLQAETGAVLLSSDELMTELFDHREGEYHDMLAAAAHRYLHRTAVQIVHAGCDVILDWGFWRKDVREQVREYYASQGIQLQWHYVDTPDEEWKRNIAERNQKVQTGSSRDYFVDEGLLAKLLSRFEAPSRDEIDVWYCFVRKDSIE
ncbi:MAG: ATP-binding protein [Clostridia bacterium]|nr:ATP-binding protein [Clostridia bacterium]